MDTCVMLNYEKVLKKKGLALDLMLYVLGKEKMFNRINCLLIVVETYAQKTYYANKM